MDGVLSGTDMMSLSRFKVGDLIKIKDVGESIGLVVAIENKVLVVSWFVNGYVGIVRHVFFEDLEVVDEEIKNRFSDKD
tara:strand:+ start:1022 stop:1258 length:237 start_codon:yes stop_codon:yes gene_type:complete